VTTEYPEDYEAVKVVNGVETDSVDPLCSVELTETKFVISNGVHEYEEPRSDYPLWKFRPQR
jgi:hypothetical protein